MIMERRYADDGPPAHPVALRPARPYTGPMLAAMNLVGAAAGLAWYLSCILVFVLRLAGRAGGDRVVGFAQMIFVFPLALLLATAPGLSRPPLFYLQAALLLAFVLFESVADVMLRVDFRASRAALVPYVVFFFAASGGMLGVIALAGQAWLVAGVAAFLAVTGLAFAQRASTGA